MRTIQEAVKQDSQDAIWKISSALEALRGQRNSTPTRLAGMLHAASVILSSVHQEADQL